MRLRKKQEQNADYEKPFLWQELGPEIEKNGVIPFEYHCLRNRSESSHANRETMKESQSTPLRFTRGRGLLEPLLARLRADRANKLIPEHLRQGRILDIGCGSFPYFLSHTSFTEKFSVDQQQPQQAFKDINWVVLDLNKDPQLPFENDYFEAITTLAVIEHLNPDKLVVMFQEICRVLKPGGILVLTTPASWSDRLLSAMASINLVSKEEIHEHTFTYTLPLLGWYFGVAGFQMTKVEFGYFEFNLNLWATARK